MKFTKMHGIGNDYVYMDCTKEAPENPEELARLVSDRHKGIGADGLILIKACEEADFEMAMYNADGSYGKMCGNGIRCVAKYVYDNGLTDKKELDILSGGALKHLKLTVKDGKVEKVRLTLAGGKARAEKLPQEAETDITLPHLQMMDFLFAHSGAVGVTGGQPGLEAAWFPLPLCMSEEDNS